MMLNGTPYDLTEPKPLLSFIEGLSLSYDKIVVEVNGEIIPKADYDRLWLNEKDQVEIVSFVGGG